jgi:hypothetical protein
MHVIGVLFSHFCVPVGTFDAWQLGLRFSILM